MFDFTQTGCDDNFSKYLKTNNKWILSPHHQIFNNKCGSQKHNHSCIYTVNHSVCPCLNERNNIEFKKVWIAFNFPICFEIT